MTDMVEKKLQQKISFSSMGILFQLSAKASIKMVD
jgi:hypothetical protein